MSKLEDLKRQLEQQAPQPGYPDNPSALDHSIDREATPPQNGSPPAPVPPESYDQSGASGPSVPQLKENPQPEMPPPPPTQEANLDHTEKNPVIGGPSVQPRPPLKEGEKMADMRERMAEGQGHTPSPEPKESTPKSKPKRVRRAGKKPRSKT